MILVVKIIATGLLAFCIELPTIVFLILLDEANTKYMVHSS